MARVHIPTATTYSQGVAGMGAGHILPRRVFEKETGCSALLGRLEANFMALARVGVYLTDWPGFMPTPVSSVGRLPVT